MEHADIAAEIDRLLTEMHNAGDKLIPAKKAPTKAALDNWRQQIGDVYRHIYASRHAGRLDVAQSLELKEGANHLRQEFDTLRDPPWYTPAARRHRETKPKNSTPEHPGESDGPDAHGTPPAAS
jgi:hypothetical protein